MSATSNCWPKARPWTSMICLMRTVILFRSHPEVLKKYQERYVHVMVDEFQDTNLTQYELVKQIAGKYRNICVVGDPDQSIYSWRFADLRNILNFEKDYPDAKVVYPGTELPLYRAASWRRPPM